MIPAVRPSLRPQAQCQTQRWPGQPRRNILVTASTCTISHERTCRRPKGAAPNVFRDNTFGGAIVMLRCCFAPKPRRAGERPSELRRQSAAQVAVCVSDLVCACRATTRRNRGSTCRGGALLRHRAWHGRSAAAARRPRGSALGGCRNTLISGFLLQCYQLVTRQKWLKKEVLRQPPSARSLSFQSASSVAATSRLPGSTCV